MSKVEYCKKKNIVITDVLAKSCFNSIHVDLSPVELTSSQRDELIVESRKRKKFQRLKKTTPVELLLKILEFDSLTPMERSEYFLFLVNGSGLKFIDGPQSSMVDVDEKLEIIFNLNIPTDCWKILKGAKVVWWKDGQQIDTKDIDGRIKHATDEIPDDGVLRFNIDPCIPQDSGLYQVKIVSSKGDLLTSSFKQVFIKYEKPFFIRPLPKEIEIDLLNRLTNDNKIHSDVVLSCEFTGGPATKTTWHEAFNDGRTVQIFPSEFYEFSETSNIAKLRVKNILPETMESISMDGTLEPGYTCRAESCLGTVDTSTKFIIKKFPPKILTKLENMKFQLGSKASIVCRGIGWPKTRLRWILNDAFISQNDNSDFYDIVDVEDESCNELFETVQMLRFTKVTSEIDGNVKIVAKNGLGSDLQEAQLSIIPEKPFFLEHLSNLNVKEDESICLRAKISGHPPPKISWLKNEKPIEKVFKSSSVKMKIIGDQHLLYLQNVNSKLSGRITCRAVNSIGGASSSAQLTVIDLNELEPPRFTKELEETTMLEGSRVVLECGVAGNPQPGIEWTKCGEELFENSLRRFELEKSEDGSLISSLIIDSARVCDSGEYQVAVSSSSGRAITSAKLEIIGKVPKIIRKKFHQRVCVHDTFTFAVVVSGGPGAEAKWYKDHDLITSGKKFHTEKKSIDNETISFELLTSDACHEDEGLYEFRVSNESGEVATSGSLKVIDPCIPTLKRRLPSTSSCREGKKHSFECVAFGRPNVQFKWYADDRLIFTNDRLSITRKEINASDNYNLRDFIEVKEILTFKRAETSDSGIVRVKVQNDSGSNVSESKFSVTSAPTPVRVDMVPPLIIEDLNDRLTDLGEACCFTLLARGRPTPEIQWFRNEEELVASDRIMILSARGVYQLIIQSVFDEDSAVYKARIWNEAGERTTCAQLVLKSKLGPNDAFIEPMFRHFLEDKNLQEGEECIFSANVTGLRPLSVTWFKDGMKLNKDDSTFTFEDDVTNGMYRLRINNVTIRDTGRYTMRVENDRGMKLNGAMLRVRELETTVVPDRLLEHDDTEGRTIMELLCTTKSKSEKDILRRRWIVKKGYFAVDDRGHMICQKWRASSNSDYIFKGDQDATFLGPEEFVFEKQAVELKVVTRESSDEVLWLKDGNVINGDDDDDPKYEISSFHDHLVHTLVINDVCDDDEGIYTFKIL